MSIENIVMQDRSDPSIHPTTQSGVKSVASYNAAIGYLRAFITVLVLAHHAAIAYAYLPIQHGNTFSAGTRPRIWEVYPIIDSQRSLGFSLFLLFNDCFFMALMFFISGLFVWTSLKRKGMGGFLRDRVLRLGLPFCVAALLTPIAYYPSYLQITAHSNPAAFWRDWLSLGNWPSGPVWFIGVLLAFDCLAALLHVLMPKLGELLVRTSSRADHRPFAFFARLVLLSAIVFIPMVIIFGPTSSFSFGPFAVPTSRLLLYALYFFAGIGVGAYGLEGGLLASDGMLARRWLIWGIGSLVAFVPVIITMSITTSPQATIMGIIIYALAFVLFCATSGFACLALFLRFIRGRIRIFDSLAKNAYGMYLIHYLFVTYLQYALLNVPLPIIAKFLIVFLGVLMLSWSTTAVVRRIPVVGRLI